MMGKYDLLPLEKLALEQEKHQIDFCPKLPLEFNAGCEDLISQTIKKIARQQERENELWIICEMAKERLMMQDKIDRLDKIEEIAREAFAFSDPNEEVIRWHRLQALALIFQIFEYDGSSSMD